MEKEDKGWHVVVVWECEIKKNFENTIQELIQYLDHID